MLMVAAGAFVVSASPRATAEGTERVVSLDAAIVVPGDGGISVTERIRYDFGGQDRHGIFRYLPNRYRCTGAATGPSCPKGFERRTPVQVSSVTQDGATARWEQKQDGANLVLRIGDPDRTITGTHDYVISYAVAGVLNPLDGGRAVLGWNVTGNGWTVPIDRATATIEPATADVACTSGQAGERRRCDGLAVTGLAPGEGMTVTATLAAGATAIPAPDLYQPQTLRRAFSVNGGAGTLGAVTAFGGVAAVWAVGKRGRDRRFVGGPVEVAMGRAGQPDELVPLFRHQPDVMEYTPPNGVRPGQLGTLLDERVQHRDLTASIVDLAVRGYLRITELEHDWQLDRGPKVPDDALRPYERLLLDRLLVGTETVLLSSLNRAWSASYAEVRGALYDDLVSNGWYKDRPDRSRRGAMATAFALQFGGTGLTGGLAARTTVALGALPLVIAGVTTMAVARQAGARTALGTAMTTRGRGFRRLIETPTQQEMAQFAERHDVFMEYLPYAIAFGCSSQWAKRFEALGIAPSTSMAGGWFVPFPGRGGVGSDRSWDRIASSIATFSAAAGTGLTAAAVSGGSGGSGSSGGFSSGGGFGGGGGGSW